MRTISEALKAEIEDAANAGILGSLPPAAAEKDIHITDALFQLSRVRLVHVAHQRDRTRGDRCPARVDVPTHNALVRHIYDVWRIAERHPESIEQGRTIFAGLIATDAEEFRKQHPEFNEQPYGVLRRTLERSRTHDGLRKDFEQRLKPLLFTSNKPDFEVCFASFFEVATRLLDSDRIAANAA